MSSIGLFGKAIIATITSVLLSVVAGLQTIDGTEGASALSTKELLTAIGVGLAGLIIIPATSNAAAGAWAYAKAYLASAAAGVATLIPLVGDGFSSADVLLAVAAAVGGFGATAAISNARVSDPVDGSPRVAGPTTTI